MKRLFLFFPLFIILLLFTSCPDLEVDWSTHSLTTTTAGGAAYDGIMFNVVANHNIIITRISTHQANGTPATIPVEIYYNHGGLEPSATGWIWAGTADVDFLANGTLTEIPIDLNLSLTAGELFGIYVTSIDGSNISYSISDGSDYSNSDLTIQANGSGLNYGFLDITADRTFNGTIHYRRQ